MSSGNDMQFSFMSDKVTTPDDIFVIRQVQETHQTKNNNNKKRI